MTTIVMTGGTSGLGLVAAGRLASTPGVRLLLGGRRPGPDGVDVLPLDLARLDDVRRFAAAVGSRVGDDGIEALVLNAGLALRSADTRTADGFETTFAVNHLAHYLLVRLLTPRLAPHAVVVLTTSGTHDPAEKAPIRPPRHAEARLLADPALDPDRDPAPRRAGQHAYTASKLCAVLTARGLAARGVTAYAYDPGPTPGTGLSRDYSPAMRLAWSVLGGPTGRLLPRLSRPADAGATLADLALGRAAPPADGSYARLRRGALTWADPSDLARDDAVRDRLWADSAGLLGLTT
ncbi:SDR family NAD(P)-dependent oxidoreductase [Jiangella endophytica]|uniref:SDR family NAD(P)-dependent oxidoreductase n=1 Tax=Jiangella endophytica TaxID=1623398 RepID=UPI0018E4DC69|nr:SDR family NAD(P)-dependent oxidoreductase [Jiangella endophytica]